MVLGLALFSHTALETSRGVDVFRGLDLHAYRDGSVRLDVSDRAFDINGVRSQALLLGAFSPDRSRILSENHLPVTSPVL